MKLSSLTVALVIALALPGNRASAQGIGPGGSVDGTYSSTGLAAPNVSFVGNWSFTDLTETISGVAVSYSADGGDSYTTVTVPSANIKGAGTSSGSYSLNLTLGSGFYQFYVTAVGTKGTTVKSDLKFFSIR